MRPCENPSPEDEEMIRVQAEDLDMKREEGNKEPLLEPYEFEEEGDCIRHILTIQVQQLFCENCAHALHKEKIVCPFCDRQIPRTTEGHAICVQGMCDTLDRLEDRLWKVEG